MGFLRLIKKFAIVCHRWMGVAFCLLFAWWFLSGIFMMYWDFPSVTALDRLQREQAIDASRVHFSASEVFSKLPKHAPVGVTLAMMDGRPVYRFGAGDVVYADTGEAQELYSDDLLLRLACLWTSQPAHQATREEITDADQWTVGLRDRLPLYKYSFSDGQQVYLDPSFGEIVQYTTRGSRLGAYLGPIPHWLYFTPLRVKVELWTNLILWASGLGTIMALLGLTVGIWMLSPAQKYRHKNAASSVPYTGQKRLHMILGLFFGIVTCTWAFSGMLSMDPPFLSSDPKGGVLGESGLSASTRVQTALHEQFDLASYDARTPQQALAQVGGVPVKELEFTSFDGQPYYAALTGGEGSRLVPMAGQVIQEFDMGRIFEKIARAVEPVKILEKRRMTQYDAYYLDRHGLRPLPVLFVKLEDAEHTQLYIDQRTGRTVEQHSDIDSFVSRWLYHGLHSWDYPWLYNHRPAWDIVVLTLMLGGLSLCVTSVIIAWQVVRRKLG